MEGVAQKPVPRKVSDPSPEATGILGGIRARVQQASVRVSSGGKSIGPQPCTQARLSPETTDPKTKENNNKYTLSPEVFKDAKWKESDHYSNPLVVLIIGDKTFLAKYNSNNDRQLAQVTEFICAQTASIFLEATRPNCENMVPKNYLLTSENRLNEKAPYTFVSENVGGLHFGEYINDPYVPAANKTSVHNQFKAIYALCVLLRAEDVSGLHAENTLVVETENGPVVKVVDWGLCANRNANGSICRPYILNDQQLSDPWTVELKDVDLNDKKKLSYYFTSIMATRVHGSIPCRDNAATAYQNVSLDDFQKQIAELKENWPSIEQRLEEIFGQFNDPNAAQDNVVQREWFENFKPVIQARIDVLDGWLNGSISDEMIEYLNSEFSKSTALDQAWSHNHGLAKDKQTGLDLEDYTDSLRANMTDLTQVVTFRRDVDYSHMVGPTGVPFFNTRDYLDGKGNPKITNDKEFERLNLLREAKGCASPEEVKSVRYVLEAKEGDKYWALYDPNNLQNPYSKPSVQAKDVSDDHRTVTFNAQKQIGVPFCVSTLEKYDVSFNSETAEEVRYVQARRTAGDPGSIGKLKDVQWALVPAEKLSSS